MNESMATEPILLARGLTRKFGTGWGGKHELALAGFDLAVAPGESVVLAGPNGAGKSTCLRILAGVDQPSAGTVSVLGQAPGHRRVRRRIAFVPDGSLLFPFLDARETLDFFAALHGLRGADAAERIEAAGRPLGVMDFGKKRVAAFSLGMRRRLALAVALMGRPALLLLDEPTSGLDPHGMEVFERVIQAERSRGTAIVLSSHHLEQAEVVSNRVMVLDRGLTLFDGPWDELADRVGQRQIAVEGLDADALGRLRTEIEAQGGRLVRQGLSRGALARWLDARRSDEA